MKYDPETKLANQIREELRGLRRRLTQDPDACPAIWVIQHVLACSQRPLRDHPKFGESGKALPPEAGGHVINWVDRVQALGIRSILCLMHPKELRYYDGVSGIRGGLLELYRSRGFEVQHIQWADPAHAKSPAARESLRNQVHDIKRKAYSAFRALPKPVLLHCSAGIDRSAPVAAHISLREKTNGPG